jgi:ribose transport system substrate-binding protein
VVGRREGGERAKRSMAESTTRLAVVLHMLKNQPWSARVVRDIESVLANDPSINAEFFDPAGDSAEQVRILTDCLRRGPGALIVNPIDPIVVKVILEKYRTANIPVIVIGSDVGDPDLYRALIVGDNHQFGCEVGLFFLEAMGGSGDLVEILGPAAYPTSADRSRGFRETIAGHPRMRIIDMAVGDWTHQSALRDFTKVLSRQPRIDGVFAHNDEMAIAALEAAAQAGRESEMLIVGIDALPASIRLVSQGRLAATFLYPSPGKDAVYALQAVLNGEQCLKTIRLQTWPYKSNSRIDAWKRRRTTDVRRP